MSTEPDELYTLRAQYWLGHYAMAIDEAKSIARRPMSPALKSEREVFLARCYIALKQYDKVASMDGTDVGLQALAFQAQYLAAAGNEDAQSTALDQLKSLANSNNTNPTVQLVTAQVLLHAGQLSAALACVHSSAHIEHAITCLQIYLHLDRIDLAKDQAMATLKSMDDDAILTQLGSVYINLAQGSSKAHDALHTLNALSEQYGSSPYLLNLVACAYMQQGDYKNASAKLQECLSEFTGETSHNDSTYLNLVTASVHQRQGDVGAYMSKVSPDSNFSQGLQRVQHAFDREAVKYKV